MRAAGAAAISVLTDGPFFGGSIADLRAAVARVRGAGAAQGLHPGRAADRRGAGGRRGRGPADRASALASERLESLVRFASAQGLDALVEVHTEVELDRALEAGAAIVGVNSRDLDTFRIDVAAAWNLLADVPADRVAIAESGMKSLEDVERAAAAGADAVLDRNRALRGAGARDASGPDRERADAVAVEVKICGLTRPEDAARRRRGRGGLSGRRFC